jgi:hypothetical protein
MSKLSQHSPGEIVINQMTSLKLAGISAKIETRHFISKNQNSHYLQLQAWF